MKKTIKHSLMVVSTAPERIWLDLGFDPQDEDEVSFDNLIDVTWSHDNATGYGIAYVRVDTTPPYRKWVGLTDDEFDSIDPKLSLFQFHKAIEAKLKEKNHDC
jgi:hypothetical protein